MIKILSKNIVSRNLTGLFFFFLLSHIFLTQKLILKVEAYEPLTVKILQLANDKQMVDTKLELNPGDYISFRVEGVGSSIGFTGYPPYDGWYTPLGNTSCIAPPTFLLPNAKCWSLIARIGDNYPFQVFEGGSLERGFSVQQKGKLYLAINQPYPLQNLVGNGQWLLRVIRNQFTDPPDVKPAPFLELPWDYQSQGKSFETTALNINAYFDHQYPVLSSGLIEPVINQNLVKFFWGGPERIDLDYSSHDGYDYGTAAGATLGSSVLAAADGCAFYRHTTVAGNEIHITHAGDYEHYQTRYYHLFDDAESSGQDEDDLITRETNPDNCVDVEQGDVIGKVGSSGSNTTGPHIHFMVVEDKNHDGDFEDNIPDGVTDPFGWQSKEEDPWPNYSFEYGGQNRTGNTSYYLWQYEIPNLLTEVKKAGGTFTVEKYQLTFPFDQNQVGINLLLKMTPFSIFNDLGHIKSVLPTLEAQAYNFFNLPVTSLSQPFNLNINFNGIDLTKFKSETLKIYSSSNSIDWQEEDTNLNLDSYTASAQINHLSFFTLMAERKDTTAPVTDFVITGITNNSGWYRSDVILTLTPDDGDGLGVAYTLVKVNEQDWQTYIQPLELTNEGNYQVEFYSVDNDENQEEIKKVEFGIDKTSPTTSYDLAGEGGQGNIYPGDVTLTITATDSENGSGVEEMRYRLGEDEWQKYLEPIIFTSEGIYQIEFYSQDKAGNIETTQTASFTIDRGPPEIEAVYDLDKHTLAFSGLDASLTTVDLSQVTDNNQEVVITDAVGNTTTLTLKAWEKNKIKFYVFEGIFYNQQPKIEFTDNLLNIIQLLNSKTQVTITLSQTWWVKDEILLNLLYLGKNNITYIRTKTPGVKLQTETREGIVFLKLTTDKGQLKYNY